MKERIIDTVYFEDLGGILYDVLGRMEVSEDCFTASIIGKYEDIRQIIAIAMNDYKDIALGDIELCSKDCNGYADEYILSISEYEDEDDVIIDCEPLKRDGRYLGYGADIVYILENCSSAVQHRCETDDIRCVVIGKAPEDSYKCCCNHIDETSLIDADIDISDDGHGFSMSKHSGDLYCNISFYSSELLNKDIIRTILDEFWD